MTYLRQVVSKDFILNWLIFDLSIVIVMARAKLWLQKAVKREGRVRNYLRRVYGSRAFNEDGTIKMEYLNKAIRRVKRKPTPNERSLLSALYLAKRLKRMSRKRKGRKGARKKGTRRKGRKRRSRRRR